MLGGSWDDSRTLTMICCAERKTLSSSSSSSTSSSLLLGSEVISNIDTAAIQAGGAQPAPIFCRNIKTVLEKQKDELMPSLSRHPS